MKRESFPSKRNYKAVAYQNKPSQKMQEPRTEFNIPEISRSSFINWLKELPAEERYLALRVSAPQTTQQFLQICRKGEMLGKVDNPECKKVPIQKPQAITQAIQSFMESLTLISYNGFLDCLGFDFGFVGCPQKIYETFSTLVAFKASETFEKSAQKMELNDEITEWILKAVSVMIQKLKEKINEEWDSKEEIRTEKIEKKQFGIFWNNLKEQEKRNFLYADCVKMSDLHVLIEKRCNHQIDKFDLRHQIDELLTTDSKSICNKLFKWRVKRGNSLMCSYYEIIFQSWRQSCKVNKKPTTQRERDRKPKIQKQKKKSYTKEKLQKEINGMTQKCQKVQKKTSRRKRNKKKKEKSEDASSNQTNETELHEAKGAKEQICCTDIVQQKMEDDLEECTNLISEQANKWHDARVKAYRRVSSIFNNCGIGTKLFGSCACGLAIGCSDVDIAISDDILSWFPHLQTVKEKMKSAFEVFSSTFESYAWVSNLKVITTATIPIIKFTIDTSIQVQQSSFSPQLKEMLNEKVEHQGLVNIDLTIETKKEEKSQHLGVISTDTMKKWIGDYPYLIQSTLLLKFELAKKSLNQTYTGGINTYSLVVLIVAFLKYTSLPSNSMNSLVLDKLLKFYGWQFDEKIHGIDILSKSIFFEKQSRAQKKTFQKADLEVMDPLCPEKNMTRNCYKFSQIRYLFREMHKNCFIKAKNQFTTYMENNENVWEKAKKDKFSYRNCEQLNKNFIATHIFSQE